MKVTFEALLRDAALRGWEIRLVPMINDREEVEFYAHVSDHDSDTVDAALAGDCIVTLDREASGRRGG